MGKWSAKRQRQRRACIGSTKDINIAEPINTNLISTLVSTLSCRPLLHVTASKQNSTHLTHLQSSSHPSHTSSNNKIWNSSLIAGLRLQWPCLPYTVRSSSPSTSHFLRHPPQPHLQSRRTRKAADGACAILQAPRVQFVLSPERHGC